MVEAVRKDQEGDAKAAFSLYRKALEYFVPALHCESLQGVMWDLGVFLEGSTPGEANFQPSQPCVWSFPPSDETDARRKEAIRAKVSKNPWGGGGSTSILCTPYWGSPHPQNAHR